MADTYLGGTGQTTQGKEALGSRKVHWIDISIVGAGAGEEKRGDPDGTSSMQVHNLQSKLLASPVSPSHAPSLTTWVAAGDSFSDASGDGIFVSHSQAAQHSRAQQHPYPHMEDMKPIFYSPRKPRQQQQQQQQDIRPQPHQQQLHVSMPPGQLHSPPRLMNKAQNIPPHHGDNQHGHPSPKLIQRPQHHHDVANFTSSVQ